jgi:hypothetical protein
VVVGNATWHGKVHKKEPSSNSLKFSTDYLLSNNNIVACLATVDAVRIIDWFY